MEIQSEDSDFRVIPILFRDGSADNVPQFLRLRTWADFRNGRDQEYAFHVLKCGIEGKPPGRWPPDSGSSAENAGIAVYERKLQELQRLREKYGVRDELMIEYQRKILDQWFEK